MSQQIVSTWDGVQNTNSWVHDGDVERSAVDIVELASSVAGYSAGAQAAADAASGYADTASAAVASIGTAATDAVQAVQNEGAAQMSALVDAGGVQTALIGSAGAAQIADIVTSGGVVTSAIADAGSAEIADIVSAGGAQVALVSAAGTSATGDLAAVTAAQSAALVSVGGYQSGLIVTAGGIQIAAVQAEGGVQIAAVQLAASAQVDSATSAAMIATSGANVVTSAASGAVAGITSAGSAQIAAVNSAGGVQSAAIVTAGGVQSAAVVSAGTVQSAAVVFAGGAQITAVNSAGAVQSAAVVSAGAAQITSIGSAGAAQISAVTSTGGVQVGLVQSAGTEQIALVQSAGAAEVQAIEDAGGVYQAQIDDNSQRIENINEYAEGQLFEYQTDSTEAYVKDVPNGVVQNAEVQSIAGKTLAWNQLIDYAATETVTSKALPVGTSVVSGHIYLYHCEFSESTSSLNCGVYTRVSGTNTLIYRLWSNNGLSQDAIFTSSYSGTSNGSMNSEGSLWVYVSGATESAYPTKCQLIDLTLLYGADNEPTTVEQFRAEFPADYYAYNPGTLLSTGVTNVKSVGRNLVDKATVPFLNCYINTQGVITAGSLDRTFYVPVEPNTEYAFQAALTLTAGTDLSVVDVFTGFTDTLPANGVHCISFKKYLQQQTISDSYTSPATAKYFVCKIAQTQRIVLDATMDTVQLERGSTATAYTPYQSDTLTIPASVLALPGYGWSAGSAKNVLDIAGKKFTQAVGSVDLGSLTWTYNTTYTRFAASFSDAKIPLNNYTAAQLICPLYLAIGANYTAEASGYNMTIAINSNGSMLVKNTSYTDADVFKTAMSGVMLYYELASPVVTAIDPVDTMLAVEDGGTVTFQNSNGTDYRIPVASSVRYQEAVDLAGRVDDAEDDIAQNTEDIATNTADIAANTASITALDIKTDITDKNVGNVLSLLNGALSAEQTDSTAAYAKTVPSGAQGYAAIESIGGKTLCWNQICKNGDFDGTTSWSATSNNGTISASNNELAYTVVNAGTGYAYGIHQTSIQGIANTHKIFITADIKSNASIVIGYDAFNSANNNWGTLTSAYQKFSTIVPVTNSATVYFCTRDGATVGDVIYFKNVRFVNLTLMFGSGNEPATVAEFSAMFPTIDPAYNAGSLKSAAVTGVKSVGVNKMPPVAAVTKTFNGVTAVSDGTGTITFTGTSSAFTSFIFDLPTVLEFPVSVTAGGTYAMYINNSFTAHSIAFIWDNDEINTWNLGSTNRVITIWKSLEGKRCNKIAIKISSGAATNGTVSLAFLPYDNNSENHAHFIPYMTQTLPIPSAVQALPGYGWSAGTSDGTPDVYNGLSFTSKTYTQRIAKYEFDGTETITLYATGDNYNTFVMYAPNLGRKGGWNCPYRSSRFQDFKTVVWGSVWQSAGGYGWVIYLPTTYTSADDVKTWLAQQKAAGNPVTFQYELATPSVTDISQYLTDDNLIEVEPGGTVSFPNALGDDYRLPVPSDVEYTIDLAPDAPSTDGTYTLQCTVADGVPTYSWVSA